MLSSHNFYYWRLCVLELSTNVAKNTRSERNEGIMVNPGPIIGKTLYFSSSW